MRDLDIFMTDLFPYLEGEELKGETLTLTIKDIRQEKMKSHKGAEETKYVLYFSETPKGFVLNKTNAKRIAVNHGKMTGGWAGKKITLYTEEVKAFGETHNALRVAEAIPDVKEFPNDNPTKGEFFSKAQNAGFDPISAAEILRAAGFTNGYDPKQAPQMWAAITAAYEKARKAQIAGAEDGPMPQAVAEQSAMDEVAPGPIHSVRPMPGRVHSGDHKPSVMDEVEADATEAPF